MISDPIRVIIDTNVWISYLIGYQVTVLDEMIVRGKVKLVITEQLIEEIQRISKREKFRKYFTNKATEALIDFLKQISENITIDQIEPLCRDSKDDFLLALATKSSADYLITGDKDLLIMKSIRDTRIISPQEFSKII